jgi:hypothetical protein
MGRAILSSSRKGISTMTTILALNAASSFLASLGIGGFFVLRGRRLRRQTSVRPVYVTTRMDWARARR